MSKFKKTEVVDYFKSMAAFYEAMPEDFPVPSDMDLYGFATVYLDSETAKEHLALIGSFEKSVSDDPNFGFIAIKQMGVMKLKFRTHRELVCERKVVGKKLVPRLFVPEYHTPARVIEEHEEEIVEWDCKPILAPEQELVAQ